MICNPLRHITIFNGQVANTGNDSAFIYQDCINARCIYMEECINDPKHFENLKLMFSREPMKVQVKHQFNSTLCRTPVICTGNAVPWQLKMTEEKIFLARMHWFRVTPWEELRHVKQMHPKMWWFLIQQYGRPGTLIPMKKLMPLPEKDIPEIEGPLSIRYSDVEDD